MKSLPMDRHKQMHVRQTQGHEIRSPGFRPLDLPAFISLSAITELESTGVLVNPLPDNKILVLSKLTAFSDNYLKVTRNPCLSYGRKHNGKRRKCWFSNSVFNKRLFP